MWRGSWAKLRRGNIEARKRFKARVGVYSRPWRLLLRALSTRACMKGDVKACRRRAMSITAAASWRRMSDLVGGRRGAAAASSCDNGAGDQAAISCRLGDTRLFLCWKAHVGSRISRVSATSVIGVTCRAAAKMLIVTNRRALYSLLKRR